MKPLSAPQHLVRVVCLLLGGLIGFSTAIAAPQPQPEKVKGVAPPVIQPKKLPLPVAKPRPPSKPNDFSLTLDPARQAGWEAAVTKGNELIKKFQATLKDGTPDQKRKAALTLQADPMAIALLNEQKNDGLILAHKKEIDQIKSNTKDNIKKNMVAKWNEGRDPSEYITEADVQIFEATNKKKSETFEDAPKTTEPQQGTKTGGDTSDTAKANAEKDRPTSGQDWDVTVLVRPKPKKGADPKAVREYAEVPPSMSKDVVEVSYYEGAGGEKTFGKLQFKAPEKPAPPKGPAKTVAEIKAREKINADYQAALAKARTEATKATAAKVAHQQSIETTWGKSNEAYTDPTILMGNKAKKIDPKPAADLSDPEQVSKAMEHKSDLAREKADAAGQEDTGEAGGKKKQADLVEVARQEMEQMRQAWKQCEKITKPRLEAAGLTLNLELKKGMDIFELVKRGKMSPEEARVELAKLGDTPETMINKLAGQVEAMQKLKPPGYKPKKTGETDTPPPDDATAAAATTEQPKTPDNPDATPIKPTAGENAGTAEVKPAAPEDTPKVNGKPGKIKINLAPGDAAEPADTATAATPEGNDAPDSKPPTKTSNTADLESGGTKKPENSVMPEANTKAATPPTDESGTAKAAKPGNEKAAPAAETSAVKPRPGVLTESQQKAFAKTLKASIANPESTRLLLAALFVKAGADGVHAVMNQLDSSVLIAMNENNVLGIKWTSADGKTSNQLSINFDNVPLQVLTDLSNQVQTKMDQAVSKYHLKFVGHAVDAYGKVSEYTSYCDAVTSAETPEQAFENLGTALFRSKVPGADIVEGAVMGDATAVAWGCVGLAGMYFPPLGMGLALHGMGQAALASGYKWWWTSSLELFVDRFYESAVFTPEKTEKIDGKVQVDRKWLLQSVKYQENVIDRAKLLTDLEASWMSYADDKTLRKNLAETDSFLAIYEECEKHPNASAKLSGRFKQQYEERWKLVRKQFFENMIERLETRKRAQMGLGLGQFDGMVDELIKLTTYLRVREQVFSLTIGISFGGEAKARVDQAYAWLTNLKREAMDQPYTQEESEKLMERIGAAIDNYRVVMAARKSIENVLGELATQPGASGEILQLDERSLLDALPMLSGLGSVDAPFACNLARQVPAEVNRVKSNMLQVKERAGAGTGLETPIDKKYLAELSSLRLFYVAYQNRIAGEGAPGELGTERDLALKAYGEVVDSTLGGLSGKVMFGATLLDSLNVRSQSAFNAYKAKLEEYRKALAAVIPVSLVCDPASALDPSTETVRVGEKDSVTLRCAGRDEDFENVSFTWTLNGQPMTAGRECVLDAKRFELLDDPNTMMLPVTVDVLADGGRCGAAKVTVIRIPAPKPVAKEEEKPADLLDKPGKLPASAAKPDAGPSGLLDQPGKVPDAAAKDPSAKNPAVNTATAKPPQPTPPAKPAEPVPVPAANQDTTAVPPPAKTPPPVTPPPPVKKAPDVIAPRPGMLPALQLPAEVVYGTSLAIDATAATATGTDQNQQTPAVISAADNANLQAAALGVASPGTEGPISPEEKLYKEQLAAYDAAWAAWKKEDDRRAAEYRAWVADAKKQGKQVIVDPLSENGYKQEPTPTLVKPTWVAPTQKPKPKPEPDGRRYFFKANPNLRFEPVEATSPATKVTFTRTKRVSIWMEIVDKDGKVVGETTPAEVNVVPPKLTLVLQPAAGAKVGQEVVASIKTTPTIPADLLEYRWLEPPTANRLEKTPNASQIVFKASAKPLTLQALAQVPHFGDALGEVRQTFSASAYTIAVTPVRRGPTPQEWSTAAGGLIDVSHTFLIDEQFSLKAQLEGEGAPADVRWHWTVNDGTTLGNPAVSEPTVSRHAKGPVIAKVEARDAAGTVLATGAAEVQVMSEDDLLKPLAVAIALDQTPIELGQSTRATATATGGKGPYEYRWNSGATGNALDLTKPDEGKLDLTVTVLDARKKTATATAVLWVGAPKLTLSVTADRAEALVGESINLKAVAAGGRPPYQFNWTPPAEGTAATGKVSRMEAGPVDARVSVTDSKGRGLNASTHVVFSQLEVALQGLQESEKLGSLRPVSVTPEVPAGMSVRFLSVPACPVQAKGNAADLRFDKPGKFAVHAEVVKLVGGREQVVAKSAAVTVTVAAPVYQISLARAEVPVGTETTARVVADDGKEPADATVEWIIPAASDAGRTGQAARLISDAPGAVALAARIKDRKTAVVLGEAKAALKIVPLEITVTMDPAGGNVFNLRASVTAKVTGILFSWSASGDAIVGPRTGGSVKVLVKGDQQVDCEVIARNSRGIEIGRNNKTTFEATQTHDPDKDPQMLLEKAKQLEQAGDLAGACTAYDKALALQPDANLTKHVADLKARLQTAEAEKSRTADAQALVQKGYALESSGNLEGACTEYEKALALLADPKLATHVADLKDLIAAAAVTKENDAKAQALVLQGYQREQAGDLTGACNEYDKALALTPDPKLKTHVADLRDAIRKAAEATAQVAKTQEPKTQQAQAQSLVGNGYGLEAAGNLAAACAEYSKALELVPDPKLKEHLTDLQARLATEKPQPVEAPPPQTTYQTANTGGVYNKPTAPTLFETATPYVVTYISTYHWNNGRGTPAPGTIGLRHSDGTLYGPWRAAGTPGQGGVVNANWIAEPNVTVKPGTYTIIDSDSATWAQNAQSGGRGHAVVKGHAATATAALSATPTATAPPATAGEALPNKTAAAAAPANPRDHSVIGPKIKQLVALAREGDQLAGIKGYADGDARMARVEKIKSQSQTLNAEIRQLLTQAGYDPATDFPLGAKIDELVRLGNEALRLGNSITLDNATAGLAQLEAVKGRVQKLNVEIRELVERESAAGGTAGHQN